MALVENSDKETPAEALVRETKARLSELTQSVLITYGNLRNYQHNNAQGVTKAEFAKALGKEAKDFDYVMGAMKRLLMKLNPGLKPQLDEMIPKRTKSAKK